MTDNELIRDDELVAAVAKHDPRLAEQIKARLQALRLRCVVKPAVPNPATQPVPH